MTSICLALNVKDEEEHIERLLVSALKIPQVDQYLIVDTGCEDKTIKICKRVLADLPGTFHEAPWEGHSHNRTELLKLVRATGADYCLMLDADMEVLLEGELPEVWDKDEYSLPVRDRGLHYPLPLLTSTKREYVYKGVAHAYLACVDGNGPVEGGILPGIVLWDHGGGGRREGKIERDRDLLAAEVGKNPADARSWFYLAQSYRDLDMVPEAIAAYKVRIGLGGWSEEVYQSLYQLGVLQSKFVNFYDGAKALIAAAEMKQNRAEALRALAGCADAVADKIPFPENEVLFVEHGAYKQQHSRPARPEVEEIFFHRYMPRGGDTVVELGAAEGTETPLLSEMVGDGGQVIAVEPHPTTFKRLLLACADKKNLTLIEAAVTNQPGEVTISDDPVIWHNKVTDGDGLKVHGVTLDRITEGLDQIDLLKVNIEGSEADVLGAAQKTLAKTRNVVVSCHDFVGQPTKDATRAVLEAAGFDVAVHDDPTIIEDGHGGRCLGDYLYAARPLTTSQVSAVIVTRGDVDLGPTLDPLPFDDIVIWDNSKRPEDLKTYGRVKALEECENDIVFSVDDDVIFTAFDELLAAYEPRKLICNMDPEWYVEAGYGDWHHLTGAGSVYDRAVPLVAVERYLAHFPQDDEFLTWCDAIVGTLAPGKRVDLGYEVREFSDGPGRLWTTPGNPERKWRMIHRCQNMLANGQAAA